MKLSKLRALVAAVVPAVAAAVSQFRCGHYRIMSIFSLLDRKDKIEYDLLQWPYQLQCIPRVNH